MEGQHQLHFKESPPETILFKKYGVSSKGLLHFCRAAVESILTFGITVWFGRVSAEDKRQLNKVVLRASKITGCEVPSLPEIYKAAQERPEDFKGPLPPS